MPQIVPPPEPRERPEDPGAQIVRWLGPVGCVLVLLLSAVGFVFCLTYGTDPVPGYEPPHDTAYYAAHLPELAQELNEHVLPQVEESASAAAGTARVTVTMDESRLANTRAAVLRYFDESLLVFETRTEN